MGGTVVWDESSPWHEDTFYSASLTPPELLAEIE